MANSLGAYYRLGDLAGSYQCIDSSGLGQTGSLISGNSGTPVYGYAGPFLYDPNTACDFTAGSNVLNGGFQTLDNSTQPPTQHQPLGGASSWTFECWLKWTSTSISTPGATIGFTGIPGGVSFPGFLGIVQVSSLANLAVGDGLSGPGVPSGTVITGLFAGGGGFGEGNAVFTSASVSGSGTNGYTATTGAVGSTVFSASSVAGLGTSALDIRVGAATTASVTAYNRVTFGTFANNGVTYTPIGYSGGAVNIQDGSWHHLAVPYSASVASIYIDGTFDSQWSTGASWANPRSISIGCDDGPINGWVGAMSDVALYTTTLTASQIQNHYQIGKWFQLQEYGASVGGVTSGRLNQLMAVEGLPSSAMLNVPYPFRTLMYQETNSVTTTSGLNYLQTMSETEPGLIFQGPNGQINAYSRQYQYLNPTSASTQGIFGDSNAASVKHHYDGPNFALVQDDLDTWNNILVQSGRSGSQLQQAGPAQFTLAAQSASVNGSRTLQGLTSLQFEYDSDAAAVAQNYLQWHATPIRRVTNIETDSYGNNGNNIRQMLQRGLYDRLTVQYQGQTPGPQFSQDSLIESITHTVNIANGPIWTTAWQMSPYELVLPPTIMGTWKFGTAASVSTLTL